jgi:hypothetical protein
MTTDHTGRFSTRVADYVKDRPGHPPAVLRLPELLFRRHARDGRGGVAYDTKVFSGRL